MEPPSSSSSSVAARGLGAFSLGLGSSQLLAPRSVARLVGLKSGRTSETIMQLVGARELLAAVGLLSGWKPTVWLWSRVAGDSMDLALLTAAMTDRRNQRGRLAAALSMVGGVTLADVLSAAGSGKESGEQADEGRLRAVKAITIRRRPEDVYAFWRDFRNFPTFMSHLDSVAVLDGRRSHWTARGPAGRAVEWDAEIVDDRPNELIAWRSLPGADVDNSGRVRFAPAPGDRGTEVRVEIEYAPPGGGLGASVARLFGQEPRQQVQADLRKVKQVLEAGEVLRSEASIVGTHVFQRPAQPSRTRSRIQPRQTTGARS
jgi:uncharacterized membrane protein